MTMHDSLLPMTVLERKAVVYVRQSTPQQVQSSWSTKHDGAASRTLKSSTKRPVRS